MTPGPYTTLKTACALLDSRDTNYRFELLKDIPWDRLNESGHHLSPALVQNTGIQYETLKDIPEAQQLLQWSAALEWCLVYQGIYGECLAFIDNHASDLGPMRSMLLFYQEKRKHQNLLGLYEKFLRSTNPSHVRTFNKHYSLQGPPKSLRFPASSEKEKHFQILLQIILVTECGLYWAREILSMADKATPVWRELHQAHAQELNQELATLIAHIQCIDFTEEQQAEQKRLFWEQTKQISPYLIPFQASASLVCEQHPDLATKLNVCPKASFDMVMHHPAFETTRKLAQGVSVPSKSETAASSQTLEHDPNRSQIHGIAYKHPPSLQETLVDRFITTITAEHDPGLVYLRDDGSELAESYAQLFQRSKHVLDYLRHQGAQKSQAVMLQINRPEDFVACFWGALLGGMIPVPLASLMTLGRGGKELEKTHRIYELLEKPIVITDGKTKVAIEKSITAETGTSLRIETTEDMNAHRAQGDVKLSPSGPDETAFIQFSSGSTGTPKGICLSHQNLLHNIISIIEHQDGSPSNCFVSWLPLFHDMGIIGYHILPLVLQAKQVLMQPRLFMKRPLTWLKALNRHQGTCTASPNFGLNRVLTKVKQDDVRELNLEHIHCLLNGSEPISWDVLERFTALLEPANFSKTAMSPGYGLAEGSLCISARPAHTLPLVHHVNRNTLNRKMPVITSVDATTHTLPLVEVGTALPGVSIRVVDDEDQVTSPGFVGHIQIRGANVTKGYYKSPKLNEAAFCGDWLRTGDLGYILDGRLVITGRHKDIIFVRGQNFYAHDIEDSLNQLEWFDTGRVAVFTTTHPSDGSDLICIAGVFKKTDTNLSEQYNLTRTHVAKTFAIQVDYLIPVRANQIPKTSSGKLQRHTLKERFDNGDFVDLIDKRPAELELGSLSVPAAPDQSSEPKVGTNQDPSQNSAKLSKLQDLVKEAWISVLKVSADRVTLTEQFSNLGGTSLQAAEVHATLEDRLGDYISHEMLSESDTVEAMADYIYKEYPELLKNIA